jgi:hypothetical protein
MIKIICAAVKIGDIIFCGPRHWDKIIDEFISSLKGAKE